MLRYDVLADGRPVVLAGTSTTPSFQDGTPSRPRARTRTSSSPSTRRATRPTRPPSAQRPVRHHGADRAGRAGRVAPRRRRPSPRSAGPAATDTGGSGVTCYKVYRGAALVGHGQRRALLRHRARHRRLLRLPRLGHRRRRQRVGAVERRHRRLRQDRPAAPINLAERGRDAHQRQARARLGLRRLRQPDRASTTTTSTAAPCSAGSVGDDRVHRHRALLLGLLSYTVKAVDGAGNPPSPRRAQHRRLRRRRARRARLDHAAAGGAR